MESVQDSNRLSLAAVPDATADSPSTETALPAALCFEVIEVTAGVYWVEAPAAGLRILCGCPADSVKHLKQRGLIRKIEVKGVTAESGPNAILLSDLTVQGGEFSNMAEFPVLQMLYRQGMLLPGHPANTGCKPLLIGRREQITAQMEYIYRGNYGLASQDELEAAGVPPAQAQEWMRIKQRFAFGQIRPSCELLDACPLEQDAIELPPRISGGLAVRLRRLDVNIFEFSCAGQSVVVDLNMGGGKVYQSPFRLGYRSLRREYFAVVHSGDGDGWDVYRPSMASIVMFQGRVYLVDAGPNLHTVLRALGIGIHEVEGIFHTHCHDDHFAGLTTLVRADHRVRYYATPAVRASVAKKLTALMGSDEASFADFFDVRDLVEGEWNDIDGLDVRPLFSPHPVETTLFQFRTLWETGWKSYTHCADIVSLRVLEEMVTEDDSADGLSADAADRIRAIYLAPADIKKVDIGGGMIHGEACDFRGDRSGRVILAHIARDLTLEEKEIGSGAPFGTVDVLIPALQDYTLRLAETYLAGYFPDVTRHQLNILLNHPLTVVNPESLLVREGQRTHSVYLILTGMVESISPHRAHGAALTAGALVGEVAALTGDPADETVRVASFVTALVFPAALFASFIRHNGLERRVRQMAEMRQFFNRTWILGEHLSALAQTRIAAAVKRQTFAAGSEIPVHQDDALLLVQSGHIHLEIDGTILEDVGVGGIVGASQVLFGTPPFCRFLSAGETTVLSLPGAIARDIPVVRWKLMETHNRLMTLVSTPRGQAPVFRWQRDYAIGVPLMDRQHQQLVELASLVASCGLAAQEAPDGLGVAMEAFVRHIRQHFHDEEAMLADLGYKSVAEHHRQHQQTIEEAEGLQQAWQQGEAFDLERFRQFYHGNLLTHMFREDSRYVRFVSSHGNYLG